MTVGLGHLGDADEPQRIGDSHPQHAHERTDPISDVELEVKFRSLAKEHLYESQTNALLDRLWHLEDVDDVGEVIRLTCF